MTDQTLIAIQRRRRRRAQGLVEFVLILPVLLFMIMAVIDFGRALFTYGQASSQLRQALRMASVVGTSSSKPYINCDGMRSTAQAIFFAETYPTVVINYYLASGFIAPTPLPPAVSYSAASIYPAAMINSVKNCAGASGNPYNLTTSEISTLKNGDILHISVTMSVRMMTPFFPELLTFTLSGQRTLIKNITLVNAEYGGPTDLPATQTFLAEEALTDQALAGTVGYENTLAAEVQNTLYAGATETSSYLNTATALGTVIVTNTLQYTPTITDTPQLNPPTNLKKWTTSGGSRCGGSLGARYIGLQWNKVTGQGVQGYYIYANGVLVGQTLTTNNTISKCGKSVSKNKVGGISGCYNLNPGAWAPATTVNYEVAAFIDGGAIIGPRSDIKTLKC